MNLRFCEVESLLGVPAHNAVCDWVILSVCRLAEGRQTEDTVTRVCAKCVFACVCVYLPMCEYVRERERQRESERVHACVFVCACVYLPMCEYARERERERESLCVWVGGCDWVIPGGSAGWLPASWPR